MRLTQKVKKYSIPMLKRSHYSAEEGHKNKKSCTKLELHLHKYNTPARFKRECFVKKAFTRLEKIRIGRTSLDLPI